MATATYSAFGVFIYFVTKANPGTVYRGYNFGLAVADNLTPEIAEGMVQNLRKRQDILKAWWGIEATNPPL